MAFVDNILIGLYFAAFWHWGGRTLGKRVAGLKVVRSHGRPVGLGRAVLWLIGYYLCLWTFLIGYLLAAFDQERRGLHDVVAGTRVVRV